MTNSRIKWVSPTGHTVMHEHADGSITYTFPNEPHPQLAFKDTSNKGALGLKAMTEDAMTDALAMAG